MSSDLGWALLLGALVAISPQSSSKPSVSLVCGMLAAVATLYYRRVYSRAHSEADVWVRPPTLMWVCAASYALLFAPVGQWLWLEYRHGIWFNGHSFFVPVLMAVLSERILRRDASTEAQASAWGFPVVALGLFCVVIDCGIRSQYLTVFGLAVCLPGISLLLLGRRRTRLLRLPLALGFFMIPIPTELSEYLYLPQLISRGAIRVMAMMDVSAVREGTTLMVAEGGFNVTQDCSGFAGIYACLGLALILAFYNRSRVRITLLFVIPAVLAVAVNIPRTAVLLLGVHQFGQEWFYSYWHTASGIAAFWLMVLPMFAFADWQKLREELA